MGGLGACVKYHCLWLSFLFFSFLHLGCRSPRLTDFDDLYVKMRRSAQGSAFWGLDDNPECLGVEIPQKPQFFGRNRHFKPNFQKLKSQYLRKYKSDRHKISNIASGRQLDFVGGLKIKSNQIQDGGGRHFEKRKMSITQPIFEISSPNLVWWWPWTSRIVPVCHFWATTKSKMAAGRHFEKRKIAITRPPLY